MENKLSEHKFRIRTFIAAVIVQVLFLLITLFFAEIGLVSMNLLDQVLEYMAIILVVALFLGIALAIIGASKTRGRGTSLERFLYIASFPTLVIILGFIMLALSQFFKLETRKEIRALLNKASPQVRVTVDGKFSEEPQKIIAELKKVAPIPAHRSHTIKRFNIAIQDNDLKLKIWIERDSYYPYEYWIFYPKYRYTKKQEVGRIRTDIFDDY